jgi:hypothetical protein
MRSMKITLLTVLVAIILVACAPDNLDITPSATVAPTSTPAPTREAGAAEPTPAPEAAAVTGDNRAILDTIVAGIPASISAGGATWRKAADETTNEPIVYQDQAGGVTAKVFYSESGGGFSEITIGVFDTPEAAQTFFDLVKGRTRTLENAEERDIFPVPNFFGGGTYGSDAIFVQGRVYTRISVPRFSSTMGEPLTPYARALFRLIDPIIATAVGGGVVEVTEEAPAETTEEAATVDVTAEATVEATAEATP